MAAKAAPVDEEFLRTALTFKPKYKGQDSVLKEIQAEPRNALHSQYPCGCTSKQGAQDSTATQLCPSAQVGE